jgi:hypothetical protein
MDTYFDIVSEKNNLFLYIQADISRKKSFETLKREFEPAICLGYIRAGIEAIIEDDVTSRFEAEELKVNIHLPQKYILYIGFHFCYSRLT